MQPPPTFQGGIGATHPSLLHAPNASHYSSSSPSSLSSSHSSQQPSSQQPSSHSQSLAIHSATLQPSWKVVAETPKQKALTYFASCLEVLGIQEEVALTEETLKKSYKRAAIRAHPDKGGSEEKFEAVTRAYAYLSEILRHMTGGRRSAADQGATVASTKEERARAADQWTYNADPIRLNPKNLDMNAFNSMFEKTHLPDPDADGYGDWLKDATGGGSGSGGGKAFKGEFNRDVFNRMFEDEATNSQKSAANQQLIRHPGEMALMLNPNQGVDLVAERPSSFTAAPNARVQYTDLRGAYTTESTVSDKVANVRVTERSYDQYKASRERAPDPFSQTELHAIQEYETRQKRADELLERRKAEMSVRNQSYFDRMKQLVLTDGAENLHPNDNRATKRIGY